MREALNTHNYGGYLAQTGFVWDKMQPCIYGLYMAASENEVHRYILKRTSKSGACWNMLELGTQFLEKK